MRALGARPCKYMQGYALQYRKALAIERKEEKEEKKSSYICKKTNTTEHKALHVFVWLSHNTSHVTVQ